MNDWKLIALIAALVVILGALPCLWLAKAIARRRRAFLDPPAPRKCDPLMMAMLDRYIDDQARDRELKQRRQIREVRRARIDLHSKQRPKA